MHGRGVHGEGACVVGACMAGGMHGRRACMTGGMHGEGGMCGRRGGRAWQENRQLQRTVRIVLECILVKINKRLIDSFEHFSSKHPSKNE